MIRKIISLFRKSFRFPTALEIFDRVVDENRAELKGNEEERIG